MKKNNVHIAKTAAFSLFSDFDIELLRAGKHFRLYEKLGSRIVTNDGVEGVYFAVWAPNAASVHVFGDFNAWDKENNALYPRWDESGIWEGFIPHVNVNGLYKYLIEASNGDILEKGDPFAYKWEIPPKTASVVHKLDYQWTDEVWMTHRKNYNSHRSACSVYEVHLGSWRKTNNSIESLSYKDLADSLVSYVTDMGFTHVEFMPVMEHPYFPSWGYQITGYFAPSSRFGSPEDFMFLVDSFHKAGIGVILDWVPSHFPLDAHGLSKFDGTHLFEHEDPKKGFHPDWKSAIFNYDRNEVRSFLISNAFYWLDKFHIDGLRVDAVASMLYLDYSREEGEWIPNEFGGNHNLGAITFLQEFNSAVYEAFPDIITIAEESTAYSGVSRPVHFDGLGFGQKWMMGWMHDTLNYFGKDAIHRKHHHNEISFSLIYAFTENFMLPLSHDEVVHGKGSLINRMPGDDWQKFANLRMMYSFMFMHPGTKLLFMGAEFAQLSEWSIEQGLNWNLLNNDFHKGIQNLIIDLNGIYKSYWQLFDLQFDSKGFEWIEQNDWKNSVISFLRLGKDKSDPLLVICNFTPILRRSYKIGVPFSGKWQEVFNSDNKEYKGANNLNMDTLHSHEGDWNERPQHIITDLAPLALQLFKRIPG